MDYEGNYQVHYEKFEGNVYFYISDSEYLKRLAYRFLGEVREKYGQDSAGFDKQLGNLMTHYNDENIDDNQIQARINIQKVNEI